MISSRPVWQGMRQQAGSINLGVFDGCIDGVSMKIYDRERTICDCMRNRNKMDVEVFNNAIQSYLKDTERNIANLASYARTLHVEKSQGGSGNMAVKNMAASVLERLRNQARDGGIPYQTCLQLFFQEEFLRRLSKSDFRENMILKGGMFIYTLTEFNSRLTRDMDFMIRWIPNDVENVREITAQICSISTENDYI